MFTLLVEGLQALANCLQVFWSWPHHPLPQIKRGAMAMSAMPLGCAVSCDQAGLAELAGPAGMVNCP